MNITYENGIPMIYCLDCNEFLEISELVNRGIDGLHCKHCNSLLGYMNDLPAQYQSYVIRG